MAKLREYNLQNGVQAMRLGDALIQASTFAHFERVRWYASYIETEDSVWGRVHNMFGHLYELEIVDEWRDVSPSHHAAKISHWALYNDAKFVSYEDISIEMPDSKELGDYVTTQVRTPHHNEFKPFDATPWADGMRQVDLVSSIKDHTLEEMFAIVRNAKHHIGVDSGIAWTAAMTGTKIYQKKDGRWNSFMDYLRKVADVTDI